MTENARPNSSGDVAQPAPISVIIPTFNRCDALAETLEVLRQCRPRADQILVVVDFGDRRTRQSLEGLYPEVHWIEADRRLGPGGARNLLIAKAKHPDLVSLDDDSYPIDMDFFAVAENLLRENLGAAVLAAGAIVHDDEEVPPRSSSLSSVAEFVGCGAAIRRTAVLQTSGYIPLEYAYGAEEVDMSIQLLDKGWTILKSDALRVRHRTSRAHQAAPAITGAHISNIALVGYLRYPAVLWPFALSQIVRRILWSLRNGRSRGVLPGLLRIPRHLWKHRSQRAAVRPHIILEMRRLRSRSN